MSQDSSTNVQEQQALQDRVELGLRHHHAGEFAEAEAIYSEVLGVDPHHADALHLLGMVAYQTGRSEAAVELIRRAIAIKGNALSYHLNLGNVLQSLGNLTEAGVCYQRALVLKPDSADAYLNLGHIFRALGDLETSLTCSQRALAINPDLAEAALALSMVLLLKGEFESGWADFERRWETAECETPKRTYSCPMWNGERLDAGRLLLWGEQGIGDEIMYAGLIPEVIRSGNSIVLECDSRLKPLFARSFPEVEVVAGDLPEGEFVAHLPAGSLPGLFRRSIGEFAATVSPYLVADPVMTGHFRKRYQDGRKLVGLAWYTRNLKTTSSRSIDLAQFVPLFALPGIRWVSLQYGDHEALQDESDSVKAPILIDRDVDQLSNIDDFAAQIAAMDLVLTIDNSTAHLAAALGLPTWLLLPFAPDWRWLSAGETSPWYPTLRLFRQTERGCWQSVLEQVEAALCKRSDEVVFPGL